MKILWEIVFADGAVQGVSRPLHFVTDGCRIEDAVQAARDEIEKAKPFAFTEIYSVQRIGPVRIPLEPSP